MSMVSIAFGPLALALAVTSAGAHAASEPDDLTWGAAAYPDVDPLPRLTGAGSEPVNAILDRLDARAATDRGECLVDPETREAEDHADWNRTVWVPFAGPRFLSITVNTGSYCGGPHPNVALTYLIYDRRTGGPADWSTLWPSAAIAPLSEDVESHAITRAPAVAAWFGAAVRADVANDADWLAQCDIAAVENSSEPVVIWLDAERGGIGLDWASLPHAIQACRSPQVMPVDEAVRLGLSPDLAQALRQGQAGRRFTRPPGRDLSPS